MMNFPKLSFLLLALVLTSSLTHAASRQSSHTAPSPSSSSSSSTISFWKGLPFRRAFATTASVRQDIVVDCHRQHDKQQQRHNELNSNNDNEAPPSRPTPTTLDQVREMAFFNAAMAAGYPSSVGLLPFQCVFDPRST